MTTNINLASLSLSQGFSIIGANSGDKAGYSVCRAGDVNGDGWTDSTPNIGKLCTWGSSPQERSRLGTIYFTSTKR